MNPSHPIPEVARFQDHVHRLLHVLDAEYEFDTLDRVRWDTREQYRVALVVARGIPAIDAISTWIREYLPSEVGDGLVSKLAAAMAALHQRLPERAEAAILAAEASVVANVPRCLSLSQAARLAAFSGTLTTTAELVTASMSCEVGPKPADTWVLVDAPTDEAVVEVISGVLHYFPPGNPWAIPAQAVREALIQAESYERYGDPFAREVRRHTHPALLLLLWSVEGGEIRRLGPALRAGEAERDRDERALRRLMNGSARTAS